MWLEMVLNSMTQFVQNRTMMLHKRHGIIIHRHTWKHRLWYQPQSSRPKSGSKAVLIPPVITLLYQMMAVPDEALRNDAAESGGCAS